MGMTGFDSVQKRCVSVQSLKVYALKYQALTILNGENNYALAA